MTEFELFCVEIFFFFFWHWLHFLRRLYVCSVGIISIQIQYISLIILDNPDTDLCGMDQTPVLQ